MATKHPELWGGLECTINRVQDRYLDQFALANVYEQPRNDEIAGLGIRCLRFPILWERHQPAPDSKIDWTWAAEQLEAYERKGVSIIAGLTHHGSGPQYTDLTDSNYPELLAAYARKVAERFPHITQYTPVNEPLTTARFSGLYGLWYPHGNTDSCFVRCLVNQLKGVVLSMKAIREINPKAQLVQTEDLGKTYSTPKLSYQAEFENKRRWLTYDILCGHLNERHSLWKYFIKNGIDETELRFFVENPCVPDVFGFNYYVTSERYLDENTWSYPGLKPGGNKRHRYVDVEAVRVRMQVPSGASVLLREAWDRYRQPMAITEIHLHCHREEQLRWFRYMADTAASLAEEGVNIVGITAWALLGSFGWNKLLTDSETCDYETGAFDLRGGVARPTALARYLRALSEENRDLHLANGAGWWQRDSRFLYSPAKKESEIRHRNRRQVIVIGKRGTLGQAFGRLCQERGLPVRLLSRDDCDISNPVSILRALEEIKPWAVVNAAGYVRVDDAEQEPEACYQANREGPRLLAMACAERGISLVCFSSDLVFDGTKETAYVESDRTNPLNVYGRSKALCEMEVLAALPEALMVRTSAFFGPWDQYNFFHMVEERLRRGETVSVPHDLRVSPTYVPDLVHASLDLLVDRERGIWHLANEGAFSWAELADMVAQTQRLDRHLLEPVSAKELGFAAPRPRNTVLASERATILPRASNAFHRYFAAKSRLLQTMD